MFDRFTDDAKRTLSFARKHALRLRHECIAPEHILLGLLELPQCSAVVLLQQLGVDRAALAAELVRGMQQLSALTPFELPFTPSAKKVLEHTLEECAQLGHRSIDTGHLLLGLLRTEGTMACAALAHGKVTPAAVRAALVDPGTIEHEDAPDTRKRRCLLISNSTMHGGGYLEHCAGEIRDFLGARKRVLFVPYALHNHAEYAAKAAAVFGKLGHELVSAHTLAEPAAGPVDAEAVFVGGGNTFRLLDALYRTRLLGAIQQRALAGMPYIGSSAGTNVATLSIRTTNDMPIVMPPSFTALQLVPFQINPHYLDVDPKSTHMGETREERIRQFLEEHDTPVLGLREGCMLRVEGERMELRGTTRARLFRRDRPAEEFTPPCDLSFLLQSKTS
jgi:dipeptidase E